MKDRRVAITGANGFLGLHAFSRLVSCERTSKPVLAIVRERRRFLERLELLSDVAPAKDMEIIEADFFDSERIAHILRDAHTIIHCAGALGGWGRDRAFLRTQNYSVTESLLHSSGAAGVSEFVFLSTCGVLGPIREGGEDDPMAPANDYELSKAEAENLVRSWEGRIPIVKIVRPAFVFGPLDAHVLPLFQSMESGYFRLIGPGNALLHPTYAGDYSEAMVKLLSLRDGGIFHIAGDRAISVREFYHLVCSECGIHPRRIHVPLMAAHVLAWISEAVSQYAGGKPFITRAQVSFFTEDHGVDTRRTQRRLGWEPHPVEEGIARTVAYYQATGQMTNPRLKQIMGQARFLKELTRLEDCQPENARLYLERWRLLSRHAFQSRYGYPSVFLICGLPEKDGFHADLLAMAFLAGFQKILVVSDNPRQRLLPELAVRLCHLLRMMDGSPSQCDPRKLNVIAENPSAWMTHQKGMRITAVTGFDHPWDSSVFPCFLKALADIHFGVAFLTMQARRNENPLLSAVCNADLPCVESGRLDIARSVYAVVHQPD